MAIALVALLFCAAAVFVIVGVQMLAGLAWAFIALGILLSGAAIYLRAGLNSNG